MTEFFNQNPWLQNLTILQLCIIKFNWFDFQFNLISHLKALKFQWKLLRTYFFPSISFSLPTTNLLKSHLLRKKTKTSRKLAIFLQENQVNWTSTRSSWLCSHWRIHVKENWKIQECKKEQNFSLILSLFACYFNYVLYSCYDESFWRIVFNTFLLNPSFFFCAPHFF